MADYTFTTEELENPNLTPNEKVMVEHLIAGKTVPEAAAAMDIKTGHAYNVRVGALRHLGRGDEIDANAGGGGGGGKRRKDPITQAGITDDIEVMLVRNYEAASGPLTRAVAKVEQLTAALEKARADVAEAEQSITTARERVVTMADAVNVPLTDLLARVEVERAKIDADADDDTAAEQSDPTPDAPTDGDAEQSEPEPEPEPTPRKRSRSSK